jgi:hypothetical protein
MTRRGQSKGRRGGGEEKRRGGGEERRGERKGRWKTAIRQRRDGGGR